ncbi:hypothetical protein Ahy_A08g037726 [Arachis hypogaea]|uniref:Aminotransferase-like plant mobile domain-containing protein n=1 Tax=Arachis hypogaea TaxID=3818 RepID=A0A445BRL1_ARAHY|nr:hypothetical protein Ahy_A08g037726 [Arachis hypogaea]
MGDDPARLYRLDGVAHIVGVINDEELLSALPPPSQIQKFAVNCTWFQEIFGECPEGADEATVRRYAHAYIMMLLGTQLFADKSGNRIHIRCLPYVARLEKMGGYSSGSAAFAWLYRYFGLMGMMGLAGPWHPGYNPGISEKGPRVQMTRLRIDMLQSRDFIWMPYSTPDVVQVVHPEVLEPCHTALWRSVTSLIYFGVVEWHQVDRVLPQFGGVQHWHLHWETRAGHVLRFDVVADSGPSHDFLDWWRQNGKRFLSPKMYLGDPRDISIPVEATQRGVGRVPDMDRVYDVLDRRRVDRRARVRTRRSDWEWRWLDQVIEEGDQAGRGCGRRRGRGGRQRGPAAHHVGGDHRDDAIPGGAAQGVVIPDAGGAGGEWYGSGMGDSSAPVDARLGEGPLGDYFVGVPGHDQTLQESTPWVSLGTMFLDFLSGDSLDAEYGGEHFLDEITAIMQEDEAGRRGGQTTGSQAHLDVDLNEPPSVSPAYYFALGGTPPFAITAGSHSVAGPSSFRPLHV